MVVTNMMTQYLKSLITKFRRGLHKKLRQTNRISRKSIEFACLLIGASFVSLSALGFAKLAELGLHWNSIWTAKYPLAVWFI